MGLAKRGNALREQHFKQRQELSFQNRKQIAHDFSKFNLSLLPFPLFFVGSGVSKHGSYIFPAEKSTLLPLFMRTNFRVIRTSFWYEARPNSRPTPVSRFQTKKCENGKGERKRAIFQWKCFAGAGHIRKDI